MSLLEAVVLGLVQGITEFLPISSSAHLVLVPWVFGWPDAGVRFAVVTNAATLVAAVLFFRRDLWQVLAPAGTSIDVAGDRAPGSRRLLLLLIVATLPAVAAGAGLRGVLEDLRTPLVIGSTTLVFGVLLGWADHVGRRFRTFDTITLGDAWWIGVAQALALVPGTSRSGITITVALLLGIKRPAAARFAFLMAIPIGVAAVAKDVLDLSAGVPDDAGPMALVVGSMVALVSAYLVIGGLLRWLERKGLGPFVLYRLLLGGAILSTL